MIRSAGLTLMILSLSACASNGPPQATGPWHPLNPGKWAFHENKLTQPPPGLGR
jgi:hypothetical protein